MNNILLYLGALVAMALAALFAVPQFVDWNDYRGTFEEEASRILGREVRVGGEVSLTLLPTPAVRFGQVRIADTTGRVGEPFFRTDDFALHLNVGPLLKGVIEANQIELRRPVLRLAFDDSGRGNWSGLGVRVDSPLMPQDISLQSVRITDGLLVIHGAKGEERLKLRDINGELSAEALEGPFKFKGTYRLTDAVHELRLATARPDADGSVRLKAGVEIAEIATKLDLEGRLLAGETRPRLEGDLTARLAVLPGAAADGEAFEIKGKATADSNGFAVADLNFGFDAGGRPQLITGRLDGTWKGPLALKAMLGSRWIDLDRLVGTQPEAGPGTGLSLVIGRTLDLLPPGGSVSLDAAFDQISLAGDMIGNARIGIDRTPDRIVLREVRANLPGATRLDLRGAVTAVGSKDVRFDGEAILRGQSLMRFLNWTTRGPEPWAIARDGAFGWVSSLSATTSDIVANDVRADLAGQTLKGGIRLVHGVRPHLAIDIEARDLDPSGLPALPGGLSASLHKILPAILPGVVKTPAASPAAKSDMDLTLRAEIGRLKWHDRSLRDVDAHVVLEDDRLLIPNLRLNIEAGPHIEVSGALNSITSTPTGVLTGVVAAPSPAALEVLTSLIRVPEAWQPSEKRAAAMTPLRLAYRLQLPSAQKPELIVSFDGSARDMRVVADGKLAPTDAGWDDPKADVSLDLSSADARSLLALIAPQAGELADRVGGAPARLSVRSLGQLSRGAFGLVSLDSEGMVGSYSGKFQGLQIGTSALRLDGDLTFKGEMQRAFVLAGLGRRPGIGTQRIDGNIRITSKDDAIMLEARELRLADTRASGTATVTSIEGRRHIDARLSAEHASVASALALVLDPRGMAGASSPDAATARAPTPWPEEAFDLSNLDGISAKVALSTPVLSLAEGLKLQDAKVEAALGEGMIDITKVSGTALDGHVEGAFKLEKAPGGASLSGQLAIKDAALKALGSAEGEPAARGSVAADLVIDAKATSPRGLVASLRGKGSADIRAGRMRRLTPKGLRTTAEAFLQGKQEAASTDVIRERLASSLDSGEVDIGTHRLSLSVQDGRISVEELSVATPEGRLATRVGVDLTTLKLDSEWRIEAKSPDTLGKGETRAAMPPVTVTYAGPLSALGSLEPQLKSDAFERELVVRRMERDVDELERLRKQDEDRARLEAERLRRLEDERTRAGAEHMRRLEAAREMAPVTASPPSPPPATTGAPPVDRPSAVPTPESGGSIIVHPAPGLPPGAPPAPSIAPPPPEGASRAPHVRVPAPPVRPRFSPFPTDGG